MRKRLIALVLALILASSLPVAPAWAADCGTAGRIDRQEAQDFALLLAKEYSAKNQAGFMGLVSPAFAGDGAVLASAVRRDFQLLGDIRMRFTVLGVTAITDFAVISVSYQRSVTPTATGRTLSDSGVTELAIARENGCLKLLSMKRPLLFGLANPAVATGAVVSGQNQRVILIAHDGTVSTGPVE